MSDESTPFKVTPNQADQAAALSFLGFDSMEDAHYWAMDNNELNRLDALIDLLANHRQQAEKEATTPLWDRIARLEKCQGEYWDECSERHAERTMLCQDKDVNNIIQTRIETGAWRINNRGFLTRSGGAFTS